MKSLRWLGVGLLVSLGCATGAGVSGPPTLEELRRAAAAHPKDAGHAQEVALAELFSRGGDPSRADAALEHALTLEPSAPRVLFARALLADAHGQPARALDHYLQIIELAARSRDPVAPHLIEIAAYAVAGLEGDVVGYTDRVRTAFSPWVTSPSLPASARGALADVLFPLLNRAGNVAAVRSTADAIGCVPEVTVAGPFGPRQLLDFDRLTSLVDVTRPLAPSYDLGPGRGPRAVRSARARACTLHLGAGPVAEPGTSFAQANVVAPKAGAYVLRVDTPNHAEVFVDGRSVRRIDRRTHIGARAVFVPLELTAGPHRITLALAARHPNPVVELALSPATLTDAAARELPFDASVQDGFGLYLRVAIQLARGDVLGARASLSRVVFDDKASPMLLLQRSGVAFADPLVPEDVKHDEVRRYLAVCLARDPALWAPPTQLATLAAKSGRMTEAIAALRATAERFPDAPRIAFALVELLRNKGFDDQADREVLRQRERVPDSCRAIGAELDMLRSRGKQAQARQAAERVMQCDAQSNVRYTMALDRRDFVAARAELQRLIALEPEPKTYSWLLAQLALHKNLDDAQAVAATLAELRARYPRSYVGAIEEIDQLAAAGQPEQALAKLETALAQEPTSMASLHRLPAALGGKHVMSAYRKDGKQAIDEFLASGATYEAPQVLVLDYLAIRLFEDGSSLELVHTVQRAQSDEAVNELGEVHVPEDAQVLSLRAWKPDGRRLEADGIAGKDSISLPNVEKGDFIELEYLQAKAPADGFPRGYLGERFYFTSFEVPFHHSQMVVVLPKDLPYAVDPRGDAPKTQERMEGDLRILTFDVQRSTPLVAEPGSVSPREFIPSIRVGVRATWAAMVESLRDALVDRDLYDPQFAALASEIVGEAAPGDVRLRAERLYAWVLQNIDNNNDVFSQAALMLRAKAGNRARVLHYLLGLAGVPSQLALSRNFTGDVTPSEMADADTYDQLLVRVDATPEPIWLFTVERWAPFGFMPAPLRGQRALLLQRDAPSTSVSQGLLGDDYRRIEVDLALRANGSARIDVAEIVYGADAVAWRGQLEQIPAAELERRFEQDYVARLFPGAVLVSLQVTGREQAQASLTLSYSVDVASYGRRVAGGVALPVLLSTELSTNFARSASRTTTAMIGGGVRNFVTARIKLPVSARPAAVSPSTSLTVPLPGGLGGAKPTFQQQGAFADGVVTVTRSLVVPPLRVAPKDYPAFAQFCRQVDEAEARELLVLMP
jgi:cellulose synthase operon protein C